MFGIDWQELLVIVFVAVLVIGPKDLPRAMRTAGKWLGKVRRTSNHFRAGVEAQVPQVDLSEHEMRPLPAPAAAAGPDAAPPPDDAEPDPAAPTPDEPQLPLR
jgi:sec-independent protein translocase protein TatB